LVSSQLPDPGRRSLAVVDRDGLYFAVGCTTERLVFLGGIAAESLVAVAPEADVAARYSLSPTAHVEAQTRFIFDRYARVLEELGSDLSEVVQVEQYIPHKVYANGYLEVSRAPGFMERRRPTSALVCVGDFAPEGCVVNPLAIAVLPADRKEVVDSPVDLGASLTVRPATVFGEAEGPYNEIVITGDYVFTVGQVAVDYDTGSIPDEVRVPEWVWWGSEIRNEATYVLQQLSGYLDRVGGSLSDVVHVTVYLSDLADLYELDRVWRTTFPHRPPTRTVVPARGFGVPRLEAHSLGHRDNAVRLEQIAVSARHGGAADRQVIEVEGVEGPASRAVAAGELLWISGQLASLPEGLATLTSTATQLDQLFERLDRICRAAETTIANLVRLRAFLTDPLDAATVYSALKRAVPNDPPTVLVTTVPGPLALPGCTVMVDAIAYIPNETRNRDRSQE
jgi:enamine deaminase RidA (YjgF/YER057c/UK114 family)